MSALQKLNTIHPHCKAALLQKGYHVASLQNVMYFTLRLLLRHATLCNTVQSPLSAALLLATLLLLPISHASAEWLQYAETDRAVFYLETSTVRSDNHFRTAWEIQSLRRPDAKGAQSRMLLYEYECQWALFRILAVRVHDEAMAGGRAIASDDTPGSWDYATPDTPVAKAVRIVCGGAIHD